MKVTERNIIRLWFGADTPIRQYKIKMNARLWVTCQRVSLDFNPPSGAPKLEYYNKSDKVAFARAVQEQLQSRSLLAPTYNTWTRTSQACDEVDLGTLNSTFPKEIAF